MKFLNIFCLLVSMCDVIVSQQRDSDVISSMLGSLPDSMQAMWHTDDVSGEFDSDVTREYIQNLQEVFRFANLGNTPIGEVLANGGLPVELGEIGRLSVDEVVQTLADRFKQVERVDRSKHPVTDRQFIDFPNRRPGYRSDINPRCKEDYDTIALPLTNGLLRRAGEIVLTEIYADAESQDDFCDISCSTFCPILAEGVPPNLCYNVCYGDCTAAPFNRSIEIEIILDIFIEEVEAYGWGRRSA